MNKILAVLLAVLCLFLIAAEMPPALPSSFYGQVTGYPAGTQINILRDGAIVSTTPVFSYPGYGTVYAVNVPGATGDEGKALTFQVAGVTIASAVWHSGTNVYLNLSAPIPTPPPAPVIRPPRPVRPPRGGQ
jgi:hypothetical protein